MHVSLTSRRSISIDTLIFLVLFYLFVSQGRSLDRRWRCVFVSGAFSRFAQSPNDDESDRDRGAVREELL